MHSVGNDIVDLAACGAAGRSGDIRFLRRVLGPDEQEAVLCSDMPDRRLWSFWAAKETAYKAIVKSHPDVASWPVRYRVILDTGADKKRISGIVATPRGDVRIRIFHHPGYVHCIGTTGPASDLEAIVSGQSRIDTERKRAACSASMHDSFAVRQLAACRIAEYLDAACENIRIVRQAGLNGKGPPEIFCNGRKAPVDVSLSHDGRFAAYAFLVAAQT